LVRAFKVDGATEFPTTVPSRKTMPKDKKKPCKNCEGRGLLKVGDKKVKCQRCGGTGVQA
jgi:DnaJ-class molecular chaperone